MGGDATEGGVEAQGAGGRVRSEGSDDTLQPRVVQHQGPAVRLERGGKGEGWVTGEGRQRGFNGARIPRNTEEY